MTERFSTILGDLEAATRAKDQAIVSVDQQTLARVLTELKRARRAEDFWRRIAVDESLLTPDA